MIDTLLAVLSLIIFPLLATIDLNFAELEYLADHLLPEECRRLVAAAHFKSYNLPNSFELAEQAIPKDIPCIQMLLHWNSAEGRGETHEVLEHRLRQMGKNELADWLGKTVFQQLGEDLEKSLQDGLQDVITDASTIRHNISAPTLYPPVEVVNPAEWLAFDSVALVLLFGLIILTSGFCCYFTCAACTAKHKNKKSSKINFGKAEYYEMVENHSSSESEDKFDIRYKDTPT